MLLPFCLFLSCLFIFSNTYSSNSEKLPWVIKIYAFSGGVNPLAKFSNEWNDAKYTICNTAIHASFLTDKEKETVFILNLARSNPSLFLTTVVLSYPVISENYGLVNSTYFKSLLKFLKVQEPLPLLYPDEELFKSAYCHAKSSGSLGYLGHDRQTIACKQMEKFNGECCFYGSDNPLDIVVKLMIDQDVPSLGHRKILFSAYSIVGVSIQPHERYGWNTVLDFGKLH